MPTRLSPPERTRIEERLLEAADRSAVTVGMRKTTVEQLADHAGITRAEFYSFYACKELLYFEMVGRWQDRMYEGAWAAIESAKSEGLSRRERMARALISACEYMEENRMLDFMASDLPLMLRKLPSEMTAEHYTTNEERIRELILRSGATLLQPLPVAVVSMRALLIVLMRRSDLGREAPQAMRLLIQGLCTQLIAE